MEDGRVRSLDCEMESRELHEGLKSDSKSRPKFCSAFACTTWRYKISKEIAMTEGEVAYLIIMMNSLTDWAADGFEASVWKHWSAWGIVVS